LTDWRITLSEIDFGSEESEAVAAVLHSRWLTMGMVTQRFEKKFAEYCGVEHAIAVANGTAALHLAYWALGLGPGDEIICPSLTFAATANAALYCNATPVFADIQSLHDLHISPESIRQKITPRTRAIAVMHYGGYPCNMSAIQEIAAENRLALVEDACHAIGAEDEKKKCGGLGNLGCFSFFSNKNMATGEGGMVVTNDARLAQKLRLGRSHGMTAMSWDRHQGHAFTYDIIALGFNYRMDEIRAALGEVQLSKLDANNRRRRELTQRYHQRLAQVPGLILPFKEYRGISAFHLLPILLPMQSDRSRFMTEMKNLGIQTSIHYPPIHRFSYYQTHLQQASPALPITEEAGRRLVTLPLHPLLTAAEVDEVCQAIQEILTTEK
jgi:dTDP-4-amino-4,6-dideoxygalactose transaminase